MKLRIGFPLDCTELPTKKDDAAKPWAYVTAEATNAVAESLSFNGAPYAAFCLDTATGAHDALTAAQKPQLTCSKLAFAQTANSKLTKKPVVWQERGDGASCAIALGVGPQSSDTSGPILLVSIACDFRHGWGLHNVRLRRVTDDGVDAEMNAQRLLSKWLSVIAGGQNVSGLVLLEEDADILEPCLSEGSFVRRAISAKEPINDLSRGRRPTLFSFTGKKLDELAISICLDPAPFAPPPSGRVGWLVSATVAAVAVASIVVLLAYKTGTTEKSRANSRQVTEVCLRAMELLGPGEADSIDNALDMMAGEPDQGGREACFARLLRAEHLGIVQTAFATAGIAREGSVGSYFRQAAKHLFRGVREILMVPGILKSEGGGLREEGRAALSKLDQILARLPEPLTLLGSVHEDMTACDGSWELASGIPGVNSPTRKMSALETIKFTEENPGYLSQLTIDKWLAACAGSRRLWRAPDAGAAGGEECGSSGTCFIAKPGANGLERRCICKELVVENGCYAFRFDGKGVLAGTRNGRYGNLRLHPACKWPRYGFVLRNDRHIGDSKVGVRGVYVVGEEARPQNPNAYFGGMVAFFPFLSEEARGAGEDGDMLIPVDEGRVGGFVKAVVAIAKVEPRGTMYWLDLAGQDVVPDGRSFDILHFSGSAVTRSGTGVSILRQEGGAFAVSTNCSVANGIVLAKRGDIAVSLVTETFPRKCWSPFYNMDVVCVDEGAMALDQTLLCRRLSRNPVVTMAYRKLAMNITDEICTVRPQHPDCDVIVAEHREWLDEIGVKVVPMADGGDAEWERQLRMQSESKEP